MGPTRTVAQTPSVPAHHHAQRLLPLLPVPLQEMRWWWVASPTQRAELPRCVAAAHGSRHRSRRRTAARRCSRTGSRWLRSGRSEPFLRKTPFWSNLYTMKTIILPRQARDKHSNIGKVEKKGVFFASSHRQCPRACALDSTMTTLDYPPAPPTRCIGLVQ